MKDLYHYYGNVVKVYDGDTITVDIDLGFHIWMKSEKVRLYRINAPEIRGKQRPEGLKSRDWLREKILNKRVLLVTYKDKKGKYGRWLADIYLDDICLNDQLVKEGLAVYKEY